MAQIDLNLSKKLFNEKYLPYINDYGVRWEVYMGSAGSGKSYAITQKLIIRALKEKIRILVCRRYGTTLRQTVFSLFKQTFDKWKITPYIKINESDMRITTCNGSEIIFQGLDSETKLLSLNDISCIWVEEAYEVPQNMIEQLNLRMRGNQSNQQIILSFNPISNHSWLYEFCEVKQPQSFRYIKSTYKDNHFLSPEYVRSLEELYTRNPAKARVYCDGEWGVDNEGLVFSNWKVEEFDALELAKTLEHRSGIDFGWNDPTAIIDTLYDKKGHYIYVCGETYKTGMKLDDILKAVIDMKLSKSRMYGDSSSPREIDFLRSHNINCKPCIKGAGSVEARIAFLQNHTIVVHPSCQNVIRELENFSYEKDKDGRLTDKTTHEFSHSIDSLGYAYSDIYTTHGLQSIDKASLGLGL